MGDRVRRHRACEQAVRRTAVQHPQGDGDDQVGGSEDAPDPGRAQRPPPRDGGGDERRRRADRDVTDAAGQGEAARQGPAEPGDDEEDTDDPEDLCGDQSQADRGASIRRTADVRSARRPRTRSTAGRSRRRRRQAARRDQLAGHAQPDREKNQAASISSVRWMSPSAKPLVSRRRSRSWGTSFLDGRGGLAEGARDGRSAAFRRDAAPARAFRWACRQAGWRRASRPSRAR